jgi:hypothetical protein
MRVLQQFRQHVLPGVVRPLRVLWNEMIGFVFLVFAVVPLPRTWRAWRDYDQTGDGLFHLIVSLIFILTMAGFGIGSFRRARKIARS